MTEHKWTKVIRGRYRYGDTGWEVAAEHVWLSDAGADAAGDFGAAVEWAVVTPHNENLDWLPTMREARARVEREVRKREEEARCEA